MRNLFARLGRVITLTALMVLSTLWAITDAAAHEIRPAVADVRIFSDRAEVGVELTLESLLAGVDASAVQDTNDSPAAADYDRLRALSPEALEAALRARWSEVVGVFIIETGGVRADPALGAVTILPEPDLELPRDARIEFAAALPPGGAVRIGAEVSLGPLILRHLDAGEEAFAGLLAPGEISPPLPRAGGAAEGALRSFARYVLLGFEHIVPKGLDHILFVLGLFFFSLRLKPLLLQVTAFTLAHTFTLALATLGIVSVPVAVVEPLIAASIVYVAIENLGTARHSRLRTAVVFGFGLLHGLGFASVLGAIGLGQGQFLLSLVGFNIGVELGQLAVILAAVLLLARPFGKQAWYGARIARPASLAIAAVGAWWFVERVFF